jgi:hypothetical protein
LTFGCTWHVEIAGEPFPNARGASFYEISKESGKLIYARDVVESPMKLGEASFSIIRVVAPLVKEQILAEKQKKENNKKKDNERRSPGCGLPRLRIGTCYSSRRRFRQFRDTRDGPLLPKVCKTS